MKKIIKLAIENTTQIRKTEDSLCELYSHDKNNGVFEFEVINETLGNEKPYAMFKFMDSQSVWKVPGTIEDNKIKILFDTTLITQDETVVCFLYLDDEERTTDFYRFKFKVKVSEIDKLDTYAVKERYFNNSIIVDKLDVVTKKELEEALKGLTVSSVEGVLTETRADELYAKKSEIYDDTALKQRVATLEERPDNNTVYDDTDLRERVVALESKSDKDTVYDDTDLKRRVSDLENKSDKDTVYDDSDLRGRVEALENKPDNNTVYDDTVLTNRVKALEERPTTAYDDTDVKRRLTSLEERPDNNTVYDDTDVKNRLKAIEDTQKDYVRTEDLPAPYDDRRVNERLEALETKTDNDTVYNDTDLKNRVEALENRPNNGTAYDDSDLKRRVSELEQRPDNNTVYDDTDVKERLTNLETKVDKDTIYDDSELKRRVSELEQRPDNNTIYDDSALTQRVEALENKPERATKEDVKGLTDRVVALENKSDKDTIYDDSDIKERLTVLENKPDNNTVYDDSALSNRVRALEDAPKINATDFATKNDLVAFNGELNNKVSSVDFEDFKKTIPAPYNDSSLVKRVETLETKQDKDTVYNDEPIKERLIALESKPFDDYLTNKSLEGYAKKTDLPVPYNDKVLSDRVLALENKTTTNQTLSINNNTLSISGGNSVELPNNKPLTGSGSPDGKVVANPGDTYVNSNVSLGDYLYYKERNPGRNIGWKVLYGSMGVNINLTTGGKIRFQRENYFVNASISDLTISLDALNSGQGRDFYQDGENVVIRFIPSKQFDARESIIPQGFRPSGNFLVPAYSKSGDSIGLFKFEQTYGIVKLILNDVNKDNVTSEMLKGINSGLIVYPTQEAWMVRLP